MQLKLTLYTSQRYACLPFNYQYPLSAAIYKIIQRADDSYAAFLHNEGYTHHGKTFKLFTFGDIRTPFSKSGDRMILQTSEAELIICFYLPDAAETFVRGLFMNQQIEVADNNSRVVFTVQQVAMQPAMALPKTDTAILLHPLSPLVTGRKNDRGHYDYRSPEDVDFIDCLVYNWMEKWGAVHDASEADLLEFQKVIMVQIRFFNHPPQQRLIAIKAGTGAETKIRGYTKFRLAVKAPAALMELALGAGLGLHNAQGMGCVAVV